MKKIISLFISSIIIGLLIYYQKPIVNYILKEFIYKQELMEYTTNNYIKNDHFAYVNMTDNFFFKNKKDIKDALYTVLNSGMDEFNLYCSDEYTDCLNDVEQISTDYDVLSNINNFVHPYNSYNKIYIATNNFGKVNVKIEKLYTQEEIENINEKIDAIKAEIITDNMSLRDQIKAFHDYIINHTAYDQKRSDELLNSVSTPNLLNTHKANGVLENHLALCSGYTDLMAIFLNSINVPNFKISTSDHIWNAVYLDDNWYHLDLTWDDPVTSTGENVLIYDFFLITTDKLKSLDTTQHEYDKTVYGF